MCLLCIPSSKWFLTGIKVFAIKTSRAFPPGMGDILTKLFCRLSIRSDLPIVRVVATFMVRVSDVLHSG